MQPGRLHFLSQPPSSKKYEDTLLGDIKEEFPKSDVVILFGAPPREEERGYVGREARAPILPEITAGASSQNAVGEVCGQWLSQAGTPIPIAPYHRVGFDWKTLGEIAHDRNRRVVLMIGGGDYYLPLACALLTAKVVSTLVTDIDFGRRLLEIE